MWDCLGDFAPIFVFALVLSISLIHVPSYFSYSNIPAIPLANRRGKASLRYKLYKKNNRQSYNFQLITIII